MQQGWIKGRSISAKEFQEQWDKKVKEQGEMKVREYMKMMGYTPIPDTQEVIKALKKVRGLIYRTGNKKRKEGGKGWLYYLDCINIVDKAIVTEQLKIN